MRNRIIYRTLPEINLRRISIKAILINGFLLFPIFINEALAQVPPPQPSEEFVPIKGLGILAIAGIVYGVWKLIRKKK